MQENGTPWYDAVKPLKELALEKQPENKNKKKQNNNKTHQNNIKHETSSKLSEDEIQLQRKRAQQLIQDEVARYEAKKNGKWKINSSHFVFVWLIH